MHCLSPRSPQAWDLQRQILQRRWRGVGGAGEGTLSPPPLASGAAAWAAAGVGACVPRRADLLPLRPEPQQEGACSQAPLDLRTLSSGKRIPCAAALSPSSGIFLRIPTSWPRFLWGFPSISPRVLASSSALGLLSRGQAIRSPTAEAGVTPTLPSEPHRFHAGWHPDPRTTPLIWYEKSALGRETRPGQGGGGFNRKRESHRPAVIWS